MSEYMLTVTARDGGVPSLSATTTVHIIVVDVNDNAPLFTSESYVAIVTENSLMGTMVMVSPTLGASDRDGSNPNSIFTFSISSGNISLFSINPEDGQITTLQVFDRESLEMESLVVMVTDNGSPSLSSTAAVDILISDVNDNPPQISGAPSSVTFTEGTDSVFVPPLGSVEDADTFNLVMITARILNADMTLTTHPDSLSVTLSSNTPGISVLLQNGGRVLQVSGSFNTSIACSILSSLTFTNGEEEPFGEERRISVVVSDGIFNSNSPQISILVTLVNDNRPILDLNVVDGSGTLDYETVFMEEGPAVQITGTVSLSDSDRGAQSMDNLRITLANTQDGSDEGLVINIVMPSGLQAVFTDPPHQLTLVGPAPFTDYITVLEALRYFNTKDEPQPSARNVTFVVQDGELESVAVTCLINVILTNDPPYLNLGGNIDTEVLFQEGEGSVNLLSSNQLVLSDPDDSTLEGAAITLLNSPDGDSEMLGAVQSNQVTVAQVTNSVIRLSGTADISDYRTVLLSITYNNLSPAPNSTRRQVQFVVSDGQLNSSLATALVSFSVVNDPPVLDLNGPAVNGLDYETSFAEESTGVTIAGMTATVSDVDSPEIISLTATLQNAQDGSQEGLALQTNISGIQSSYVPGTGTLQVTGRGSLATYNQVCILLKRIIKLNNSWGATPPM